MATFLYCRVSIVDQTLAHQRTQAEAAGFYLAACDLVLGSSAGFT
jgi:DNA invertase Pin-like site-specific DNA recombinase